MNAGLLIAAVFGLPGLAFVLVGAILKDIAAAAEREVDECHYYQSSCRALERYYWLDGWATAIWGTGWILVLLTTVFAVVAMIG
jgi:hypothetical protein